MKRLLIFNIYILLSTLTYSQTVRFLEPQVLSPIGWSVSVGNIQISSSVGEIATFTGGQGNIVFTQGFQQPEISDVTPSDCNDLPNVITPVEKDGLNDVWMIGELAGDNELNIYNRWGIQIFHARPYMNDWGGQDMSDNVVPAGTYFYVLTIEGQICRGTVTVLK